MKEFIMNPWPWWFSGVLISGIMLFLLFFGKTFGISSNLRTICSIAGAGKKVEFFRFDWKKQVWNLVFLTGAIIGGFIAHHFLTIDSTVELSPKTVAELNELGFEKPTANQPSELFGLDALFTFKGFFILALGGLLVGFGTRYAGGCTSGHAISGLSNLQVPSLIAVVGFFIGGLLMTYIFFPFIF